MERKIKCPCCGEDVIEHVEFERMGVSDQYAFCPCGWGGSYPFQHINPYTKMFYWEMCEKARVVPNDGNNGKTG